MALAITVDVPAPVAERLNTASAKRRWYPFDTEVIDWSVPLDGKWAYMPAGHSVFTGSDLVENLEPEQRSFIERWEMTQMMRNVAHGEHLLNQGILAMLWNVDPYDPSYRFLLHEVAEECQHMAMFNEWVRVNSDVETVGAKEEEWGRTMGNFTEDLALRLPEAFWVNVLLFEFVGDDFNDAMRSNPFGNDGRPLHPVLVQIAKAHTAEEARHIAYARRWLHEGAASLDDEQRREVQTLAELGAQSLIDRKAFLPVRFTPQLESFMTREQFEEARGVSPASRSMLRQLKKLIDELESLGLIRSEAVHKWSSDGVFG